MAAVGLKREYWLQLEISKMAKVQPKEVEVDMEKVTILNDSDDYCCGKGV